MHLCLLVLIPNISALLCLGINPGPAEAIKNVRSHL